MDYRVLRYEVKDAIATNTLKRPAGNNALDLAMGSEFFDAAIRADEDLAVRCVIVSGPGKAFFAGDDVKAVHEAGVGERNRQGIAGRRGRRFSGRARAGVAGPAARPPHKVLKRELAGG